VVGNKLGTPEAVGGSWEGMVYTRVFLSDMRERLGGNSFMCNPPLCITEAQLREGFEIIDRGLDITDAAYEG
jgi:adenosylmethionine-8-amino-7-oxononanoate aminotransferase